MIGSFIPEYGRGGFTITDSKNLPTQSGTDVREVILPLDDPDFKIVVAPYGTRWQVNKVHVGKKYSMLDMKTYEILGLDFLQYYRYHHEIFLNAVEQNDTESLNKFKALVDFHDLNEDKLRYAAKNGMVRMVAALIKDGANVHANNDQALQWASENKHDNVIQLLVENGAIFPTNNDSIEKT